VPALIYTVLADALKSHRETLENLGLFGILDDTAGSVPNNMSDYGGMDLSSFPNLHHLIVSFPAVFDPNTTALAIPGNVTHLAMIYPGPSWPIRGFPFSATWHRSICYQYPQLRSLSWCIYDRLEGVNDDWEETSKSCAYEGVTLDVTYIRVDEYVYDDTLEWYTVERIIQTWEDVIPDGRREDWGPPGHKEGSADS
jgi:hypothetical protein